MKKVVLLALFPVPFMLGCMGINTASVQEAGQAIETVSRDAQASLGQSIGAVRSVCGGLSSFTSETSLAQSFAEIILPQISTLSNFADEVCDLAVNAVSDLPPPTIAEPGSGQGAYVAPPVAPVQGSIGGQTITLFP